MIQSRSTKFTLAFVTAAALLAVIGALAVFLAKPESALAGGSRLLHVRSVNLSVKPATNATVDDKTVDIAFKWKASKNATGYLLERRERIGDLLVPYRDAKFTPWVMVDQSDTTGKRATRVEETYSFNQVGKVVEWHIQLHDANGFKAGNKVVVSWGVKRAYRFHHVIKRAMFH